MGFADFVHCPASSSLFRWLCRDILIFPFSVPFFSFCFFLNYWLSSYLFLYFFAFLFISLHSCSYLCIPVHIFALLFISLHSCSYPCIPVHITSIYASFTSTFSYLFSSLLPSVCPTSSFTSPSDNLINWSHIFAMLRAAKRFFSSIEFLMCLSCLLSVLTSQVSRREPRWSEGRGRALTLFRLFSSHLFYSTLRYSTLRGEEMIGQSWKLNTLSLHDALPISNINSRNSCFDIGQPCVRLGWVLQIEVGSCRSR